MYLFIGLSKDTASGSEYMVSNGMKTGEQWIRKNKEGKNPGLIEGNIPEFSWTNRGSLKYIQLFSLNKTK